MAIEDLLRELRNIQPPLEPGWWPPAPGWWLLLSVVLLFPALWLFRKRQRRQNYFQLARLELQQYADQYRLDKDKQELLLGLSCWLRQVALLAFPDRQVAGLTGLNWVRFLDETMSENEFSQGHGHIFASKVYANQVDFDAENILSLCRSWLGSVKSELTP